MWRSSPAKASMNAHAIAASGERQRREVEPGRPALGAHDEPLDVRGSSSSVADGGAQQLLRLGLVEAQLGGAQLEQLALRAQAASGNGGSSRVAIASSSVGGRWLEQERDARVHVLALDQVVVLEHEHEPLVERCELVDQRWQHDLDRIGAADAERGERRRADGRRRVREVPRSRTPRSALGRCRSDRS